MRHFEQSTTGSGCGLHFTDAKRTRNEMSDVFHGLKKTAEKADAQLERLGSVSQPPAVPCLAFLLAKRLSIRYGLTDVGASHGGHLSGTIGHFLTPLEVHTEIPSVPPIRDSCEDDRHDFPHTDWLSVLKRAGWNEERLTVDVSQSLELPGFYTSFRPPRRLSYGYTSLPGVLQLSPALTDHCQFQASVSPH
ncbi:hypothetical protein BJV74DRAFT_368537 [Russula compacta]|nr:hypothetical protein BJV74DRAFT_368537 [Russula compacta]